MIEQLSAEDLLWIADKIHAFREDLASSPRWTRRLHLAIDGFLWAASVDGVLDGVVKQDGWIASGQRIVDAHFDNVPHTEAARRAFTEKQPKAIERDHIVPRAKLRDIVLLTPSPTETARVLSAYARVALVHEDECKRLRPASDMPTRWDAGVDWSKPPTTLPSAWARYEDADPQVIPRDRSGTPVFPPRAPRT